MAAATDADGPGGSAGPGEAAGPAGARVGGAADWYEVNDLGALDTLAVDLAAADELAGGDGLGPLGGNDEALAEGPSGHTVTTVAQRVKTAGAYIAALAAAAAPEGLGAAGPGTAVRNVLVFEGSGSGLLTLLAHSAISDLTETDGTIGVSTATSPAQAITTLMAEPFRCVVVDLAQSSALQFLEQVREHPELRDIPVLAHSADRPADGDGQGRLAVLRSNHGRLELLPSLDHLRERIGLYLSATRPGEVPPLASDAPAANSAPGTGRRALQGKRVLVVDDDARNVFALSSTLELHGMQVAHASDGRQGIEALLAASGHRPHLDGHHDAWHGRLRRDDRDPADAAVRDAADHRGHRPRDAKRPAEEPGRRRERLRHQAGRHRRAAQLHGALAGRVLSGRPPAPRPPFPVVRLIIPPGAYLNRDTIFFA